MPAGFGGRFRLRPLQLSAAGKSALKATMTAPDTKTLNTRHGPMLALAGDRYITGSLET